MKKQRKSKTATPASGSGGPRASTQPDSPAEYRDLRPYTARLCEKALGLFPAHLDGLDDTPEAVNAARSRVQRLLHSIPADHREVIEAAPEVMKHTVSLLAEEIQQAAWELAEALDGRPMSEVVKDRRIEPGPWGALCKRLERAASRAGWVEHSALPSVFEQPFGGVSDLRSAMWFDRATQGGLNADLLRKAVERRTLVSSRMPKKLWLHSIDEVKRVYPQYRGMLQTAVLADNS